MSHKEETQETTTGRLDKKKKTSKKSITPKDMSPQKETEAAGSDDIPQEDTNKVEENSNKTTSEEDITKQADHATKESEFDTSNDNDKTEATEKRETHAGLSGSGTPLANGEESYADADTDSKENSPEADTSGASIKNNTLADEENTVEEKAHIGAVDENTDLPEDDQVNEADPALEDDVKGQSFPEGDVTIETASCEGCIGSDTAEAEPKNETITEEDAKGVRDEEDEVLKEGDVVKEDLMGESSADENSAEVNEAVKGTGNNVSNTEEDNLKREEAAHTENPISKNNVTQDENLNEIKAHDEEQTTKESSAEMGEPEESKTPDDGINAVKQHETNEENCSIEQGSNGDLAAKETPNEQALTSEQQVTEKDFVNGGRNNGDNIKKEDESSRKQHPSSDTHSEDERETEATSDTLIGKEGNDVIKQKEELDCTTEDVNTESSKIDTSISSKIENVSTENASLSEKDDLDIDNKQDTDKDDKNVNSEEVQINSDKPKEPEATEDIDCEKANEGHKAPYRVKPGDRDEKSPKSEIKTDAAQIALMNADDKVDEGFGASQGATEESPDEVDKIDAELQNDGKDANTEMKLEPSTVEDKSTNNEEGEELHISKNDSNDDKDQKSDDLIAVITKTSSEQNVEKLPSLNSKDGKSRRNSMRKSRRPSDVSYTSTSFSKKTKENSHVSKVNSDKHKSKSRRTEEDKIREEKRKRREAKKDEEILFLRRQLAHYEEEKKRDRGKRHQSHNRKTSDGEDTSKFAMRASSEKKRDIKEYGRASKSKAEKESEREVPSRSVPSKTQSRDGTAVSSTGKYYIRDVT